jgi:selenocysteine lyase/cysteine desulfurase
VWAVSMAVAIRYIESIGWLEAIEKHEQPLVEYCLKQSLKLEKYGLRLTGPRDSTRRIWVFSFTSTEHNLHKLGQQLATYNLAVRTWGQCAHPLHESLWREGSLRMSLRITNGMEDCKGFFRVLGKILNC